MKKIILGFTLVSMLFLVACGGNSYQSEIDEAIKVMHEEGHPDIKKNNSSIYVYNKGAIIAVEDDDDVTMRYVEKQADGTYKYLMGSKAKKIITSPSDTDYAEKNGKEIKK
ncbi:hypothetical protein [Brochothrix thermosphacta]|uniref:hypothetical protein n=1 Tax=Brochothrix thermosphacta TaxID=2756 RepID=UPI00083FD3ED|nr:hypothetical protein [Brochothrix thermosphacta]ODJ64894.1 hypothetical protein BFR36_09720 [Brochothrix thermosphacta]SOC32670.1 exported protein of unknown function [Brochothrix thermosphacta]